MHLMILKHYTRVPVLPASDKIFGFFLYSVIKKPGSHARKSNVSM